MLGRRLAVTAAAFALACMPALVHAQDEQEQRSEAAIFGNVIDASVRNADILADGMNDPAMLAQTFDGRDIRVVEVHQLLDDQHEQMLANSIDGSIVLSSNRLLARDAVLTSERLSQYVQEHAISPDRIIAIDTMTPADGAVTLYVLDVPALSSPPTVPSPGGTP